MAAVDAGRLSLDPAQLTAVQALDTYVGALQHYHEASWLRRRLTGLAPPAGCYMVGSVGRGKTYLLDLLMKHYRTVFAIKRVHFHSFNRLLQKKIHGDRARKKGAFSDVVADLVQGYDIICFDEFYLEHISDAMMLKMVFETVIQQGVGLLITSNFMPHDLYPKGIHRELVVPFMEYLQNTFTLIDLGQGQDYRALTPPPPERGMLQGEAGHQGAGLAGDGRQGKGEAGDSTLQRYAQGCHKFAAFQRPLDTAFGGTPQPTSLIVEHRQLRVLGALPPHIYVAFQEICGDQRSVADYLSLVETYSTWFVAGVPAFGPGEQSLLLRFIHLIDVLYEHQSTLYMAGEPPLNAMNPHDFWPQHWARARSRLGQMLRIS